MKKHTIIFLIGMVYSNTSHATTLLESLQRYCVPKDGGGCSEGIKATYNTQTGNCTCNSLTKRYNSEDRACEECVTGSYASDNWKSCEPIVCPAGYHAVLVQDGVCPEGYKLQAVTGEEGCPSGYGLKGYNPTTKKWN